MKHLTSYKLWESDSDDSVDPNDLVSDINDICLELNDKYIRTECQYNPLEQRTTTVRREYIMFGLEKELSDDDLETYMDVDDSYSDEIHWSEVEDSVLRVLDYMLSNNWSPSYVILDSESHYVENKNIKEFFSKTFDRPDRIFSGLQKDFIRNK